MAEVTKSGERAEHAEARIYKAGDTLSNVVFERRQSKGGAVFGSSAPGRKRLQLVEKSLNPAEDMRYSVRVVSDTRPEDPLAGKLMVEIVAGKSGLKTKPVSGLSREEKKEWANVEKKVRTAEVHARRERRQAMPSETRETLPLGGARPAFLQEVLADLEEVESAEHTAARASAEHLLGTEGSLERALVELQKSNLGAALRSARLLERKRAALLEKKSALLELMSVEPSPAMQLLSQNYDRQLADNERMFEQIRNGNPEAYYGFHLRELKSYKRDLEMGTIVETPYVRRHTEDILSHLRAGDPVFIHGHLGSGKTELAMHVAQKYILKPKLEARFAAWMSEHTGATDEQQELKKKELEEELGGALVLSGSKHISIAELYGHQVLRLNTQTQEELKRITDEVESLQHQWAGEHPDASEEEKNRAYQRILSVQMTALQKGTVSDFFLGPVYQAMEEGRPLIIDEVNAIPHEVLISLNHILTRKPGERVTVQQDAGRTITIQSGFGIIMTGNLNQGDERYTDRQELDPAFLSRLHKVPYDYLPQSMAGNREAEAGVENEQYHLFLAMAMDKNGNISGPPEILDELWRLAAAARTIQNAFAGRGAPQFKEGGSRPIEYQLQKSVLSLRELSRIVGRWRKEGFRYDLDNYLWSDFVSQAQVASDRSYLYQILSDAFGFFSPSRGWPKREDLNYGVGGVIKDFTVQAPDKLKMEVKSGFIGPRDVVDAAFGKPPPRKEWPEFGRSGAVDEETRLLLEARENMQVFADELHSTLEDLNTEFRPPDK